MTTLSGQSKDDDDDAAYEAESRTVAYKAGDTECEGYLAQPKLGETGPTAPAKRPGVLVIHDWMGVSAELKRKCDQLAGAGYIAFGADVYGKAVRPASVKEAGEASGKFKSDPKLLRARVAAGLETLKKQPGVDTNKIAAIGFCFGGTAVLDIACSGADIDGVVSFHGGLKLADAKEMQNIKCKVLVLHGADDPFVPEADVNAFIKEMRATKADWQLHLYSGAVHSFTNPGAGGDNSKGAAYNKSADERSWDDMEQFFDELFE
ncbi:MAG: dienelactone hydrolase family protein [Planctomycetes bacterium]|nr:dienelactone hydrolase family protein [Planctomycetota bacterium]